MKKKLLALLLVVLMLTSLIPSTAFADDSNTYSGNITFGESDYGPFSFDFKRITTANNTVYSKETAILASLIAADVNKDLNIAGLKMEFNISLDNGSGTFIEQLGFSDVETINLADDMDDSSEDKYDVAKFYMGRRETTVNGEEYAVYVVSTQATDGTQWISNFDVGADTDDYYDKTGGHSDWADTEDHKGFSVAANREKAYIDTYIANFEEDDAGKAKTILLTGHSRGAAIANILGKMFEDEGDIKSYTYTFAAPGTTTSENAESYETIFNLINEDDLVPQLPLAKWGFTRYGTDIRSSVADNYKEIYEGISGREYTATNEEEKKADYPTNFGDIADCREDLYVIGEDSKTYALSSLLFADKDVIAKYADKEILGAKICPAFIMQCLASTVSNLSSTDIAGIEKNGLKGIIQLLGAVATPPTMALLPFLTYPQYQEDPYTLGIKYFMSMLGTIASGHDTLAYYILAREIPLGEDNDAIGSVLSSGYLWLIIGIAAIAIITIVILANKRKKSAVPANYSTNSFEENSFEKNEKKSE